MGKYVKVKMPKYTALAYPEVAANAVVDAWKKAVDEFGKQMKDNYMDGVTNYCTNEAKQNEVRDVLKSFYSNVIMEKIPALREAMQPIREAYMNRQLATIRSGGAPAVRIEVVG